MGIYRRNGAASTLREIFATGPGGPLNNRHKLCCMICCVIVSMRARDVSEMKRHYQRFNHLRQEQRFTELYLPEAVRGRDATDSRGERLSAERAIYKEKEVSQMEHMRPFYYDVLERKPIMFTDVKVRIRNQLEMLTTFSKSGD